MNANVPTPNLVPRASYLFDIGDTDTERILVFLPRFSVLGLVVDVSVLNLVWNNNYFTIANRKKPDSISYDIIIVPVNKVFVFNFKNKKPKKFENSQLLRKTWHVNQIFELVLKQKQFFYWSHVTTLQKQSNERSYKFS